MNLDCFTQDCEPTGNSHGTVLLVHPVGALLLQDLTLVALRGVTSCLKLVFYCWFMLSGLMSSSTSQEKMHKGWSWAHSLFAGQSKSPVIGSVLTYEQFC